MLRQLFKPITLALSPDGIAMRVAGHLPKMLTNAPSKLVTNEALLDAFTQALQDADLQKSGKNIRLIVSNHFVRYSVLPWQPEIVSREDWVAIAQHDFRKRYGTVAERWKICVSLNGFGSNIVASAVDESLFEGLNNIAQEHGCKLIAIEPFLMSVFKQYQSNAGQQWLLIAEPERVLLCEMAGNQWQRFSVISPPQQKEVEQALLLVQRSLQSVEPEKRPTDILYCSAPLLSSTVSAEWRSEKIAFKPWPISVATHQRSAALWMAGF